MKSKLIRIAVLVMALLMLVSVVGCGTTTTGQQKVSLVLDNAAGDSQAQLEIQQKIKTMGEEITVKLKGGDLAVTYNEDGIYLTGNAVLVYEGEAEY